MKREPMSYNQVKMEEKESNIKRNPTKEEVENYPVNKNKIEDKKKVIYSIEDFELAIATVKQSINDMNEISQEIDEIQTKFDTLNYQLDKTQVRFVKRIGWLKRNINDLEELL